MCDSVKNVFFPFWNMNEANCARSNIALSKQYIKINILMRKITQLSGVLIIARPNFLLYHIKSAFSISMHKAAQHVVQPYYCLFNAGARPLR